MGKTSKRINRDTTVHDDETIRLRREGKLLLLTRKEIVMRVLNTAIQTWLGGGDPISVHILACVAHQNLDAIARKLEMPSPTLKQAMEWEDMYSAYNDFKHANGDPDHRDQFVVENNQIMLCDCVQSFGNMFSFRSPWMNTFASWIVLHYGDPPPNPSHEFFPGVRVSELVDLSRKAFVEKMYPLFLDAYKKGSF